MTSPVNHVSKDSFITKEQIYNTAMHTNLIHLPALYSSTLVIKLLKEAEILTVTL